jgi:hypothetical protein
MGTNKTRSSGNQIFHAFSSFLFYVKPLNTQRCITATKKLAAKSAKKRPKKTLWNFVFLVAKKSVIVHPYGQLLTPTFRLGSANKLIRALALTIFACQRLPVAFATQTGTAQSGVRRAGSKVMAKAG